MNCIFNCRAIELAAILLTIIIVYFYCSAEIAIWGQVDLAETDKNVHGNENGKGCQDSYIM